MKRFTRLLCMLTAGALLCLALAGCGNQSVPTAGIQAETAFSITADDFLTQFISLTMREPVFVSDKDSTVNAGGKIKSYQFDDTLQSGITYQLSLDYKPEDGILTGVTFSSQLLQNTDGTGYGENSFFGLYAREAIRALEADTDLSAINASCNLNGTENSDTTYQTAALSIRTVITDGTITLEITALP